MTILGHVDFEFHIVIYFLKQFQCGYINLHFLQQCTHTYLSTPSLTLIKQFIFFSLKWVKTSISLPGIWYNFYLNDGIIILHKAHSIKQSCTVMWCKHSAFENSYILNPILVLWSCTENTKDILFMSKFTLFDTIFQDLCPDFNPYFCLIQNGWDNCFISPINMNLKSQMSTYPLNTKISSYPLPKPKE